MNKINNEMLPNEEMWGEKIFKSEGRGTIVQNHRATNRVKRLLTNIFKVNVIREEEIGTEEEVRIDDLEGKSRREKWGEGKRKMGERGSG